MKKFLSISCGILAVLAISVSCNKVSTDTPSGSNTPDTPSSEKITITATLSDALTKVSFDPVFSGTNPTSMAHKWQTGDKLRITNESSTSVLFDLKSGENTDTGIFQGDPIDGTSFTVEAVPVNSGSTGTHQTQDSDGSTDHLMFVASATGVTDLSNIELTEVSNIIGIVANLPTDVAATINMLEIEKSADDFDTSDKLNILISNPGDTGSDNILKVYANVPANWSIAADTKMFLRFKSTNTAHTVYTRYQEFTSAVTPLAGKFNYIKINCSQTDKHAGAASSDGSSADKAYLIADKYQLNSVHDLLVGDQTLRYFKMIDDINMSGITWIPLNNVADASSHYSKYIYFDGQGHTISYISTKDSPSDAENYPSIFGVLNGTVTNLKIENATIYPGSYKSGVLAGYIGSSDSTVYPSVSNVTITNSKVGTDSKKGSSSCGILCAQTDRANITISDISINKCEVASTSTADAQGVGGMIGYIHRQMTISGTNTISETSVKGGNYVGGLVGYINAATATNTTTINGTNTISQTDVTASAGVVGGVVGYANSKTTMSGCTFDGGTVTTTNRYIGGMIGSTGNQASVISDCHVKGATIISKTTADSRCGGFIGQLQTKVQIKGCSVGTNSERVIVNLATPADASSKLNSGGFVGVCYGTITKNGEVRSKAYVTVNSSNPSAESNAAYELNLGGFAGFHSGTIEYSDADVSVSACGKYVGGFCGRLLGSGSISYSTAIGTVSGNIGTGGFVGFAEGSSSLVSCSADIAVSKTGSWGTDFGAFAGIVNCSSVTKCYSTHIIEVNANYVGGFIGGISTVANNTTTISKCWSTGNVTSSSAQCGGFIGHIAANASGTVNVEDCYETGNLIGGNQRKGGLIGQINSGIVSVLRCYATATMNAGSFAQGGLVGFMNATATVQDCAAWNSSVTASSIGDGNWSSGAVIGVAWPTASLSNNFRSPDLNVKAYWGNVTGYTKELDANYDHPDVSSDQSLIVVDKTDKTLRSTTALSTASNQDNYPLFAYHGKHSTTNRLSTLASTAKDSGGLGWSTEIWDFTGDLPTLK